MSEKKKNVKEGNIDDQVLEFIRNQIIQDKYKKVISYLNTLIKSEQYHWLQTLSSSWNTNKLPKIGEIKVVISEVEKKINVLKNEEDDPIEATRFNITWRSKIINELHHRSFFSYTIALKDLTGDLNDWLEFEDKVFSDQVLKFKDELKDESTPQNIKMTDDVFRSKIFEIINFYESILLQLKAIKEISPSIKPVAKILKDKKPFNSGKTEIDYSKKLNSAKSRIQFVEKIYQEGNSSGKMTYDEAVSEANFKAESKVYKDGRSFINARRNYGERNRSTD